MTLSDILELIPADQYITIKTQSIGSTPIYTGEKLRADDDEYWEDIYPYLDIAVFGLEVGLFGHLQITLDCWR